MIRKTISVLFLICLNFICSAYVRPDVYKIDATKNATLHNNLGLREVADGDYYGAIQEFTLAIALNPRTQATSVYYNNLGETYMKVGFYAQAQKAFECAIKQYSLNFLYYQNLVKSFSAQKLVVSKTKFYEKSNSKNPMDMIILGLLYVSGGDVRRGIIKLDEFCMKEPDLIITGAVRSYIKQILPKD